jgi:hypothetical protein
MKLNMNLKLSKHKRPTTQHIACGGWTASSKAFGSLLALVSLDRKILRNRHKLNANCFLDNEKT